MLAHDVYAETNPAFGAFLTAQFCQAFSDSALKDPEVPLVYLALPLAMSDGLAEAFARTNRRTGLRAWIQRHPELEVGLSDRINGSLEVVTESLRFGCFYGVLQMAANGTIRRGDRQPASATTRAVRATVAQSVMQAQRLGYWFGSAGSAARVFDILGVNP